MGTIQVSKEKYEKMLEELKLLRELKDVDWDLVRQFHNGLENLKTGRVERVA